MNIKEQNFPFDIGIKVLIEKKGLKQNFVAEKAGFSSSTLCDMLAGRRLIKMCDIAILACAIGVTVNEIYEAGRDAAADHEVIEE